MSSEQQPGGRPAPALPEEKKEKRGTAVENKEVRRGDIFLCDFGKGRDSVQGGVRPAVVIQGDDLNRKSSSYIVAALTTVIKTKYLPSHVLIGKNFGLLQPSMVLLEQVMTANRDDLKRYIGTVDANVLRRLDNGMKKTYGL